MIELDKLIESFGLKPYKHENCGGFLTAGAFVGLISVRCPRCRKGVIVGSDGTRIFEALTFDPPVTVN